jgi:transposase InsO family protein
MNRLNNIRYDIPAIINYLNTGNLPANMTQRQKDTFVNNFSDFNAVDNRLFHPDGREVIPKTRTNQVLNQLYTEVFGFGQNAFYKIVLNEFINITITEVKNFLRSKESYQLTRRVRKPAVKTQKFTEENQGWAIDLIDMSSYNSVANQNYKYILTVIDLKSKRCSLFKLKHKTVQAVQEKMELAFTNDAPNVLLSDNGKEFQFSDEFLGAYNVRHIFQDSYVPQSDVENFNGQIRKMLSEHFVKNKNKKWIDVLDHIQGSLNWYNIAVKHRDTVEVNVPPPNENLYNQVPIVGDNVRVNLRALESSVRQAYKTSHQKHIHVKYSVNIYQIKKVFKKRNSFPYYTLQLFGNDIVDENNHSIRYKQTDLMKVTPIPVTYTIAQARRLNRI